MKKITTFLLCIVLLTTFFAGCVSKSSPAENSDDQKASSKGQITAEKETCSHTTGDWEYGDKEKYKLCSKCGKKVESEPFSENLKAEYNSDESGYYYTHIYHRDMDGEESYDAIMDKYGNTTYKFSDTETIKVYANGFFISCENDVYYLKDHNGKEVASTASLGATGFGLLHGYENDTHFLSDGYVFVYKLTETYNSTSYEIGILGTDGKWVLPMSSNNPLLKSGIECSSSEFHNELLYVGDGCLVVNIKDKDKDPRSYGYDHNVYNFVSNKMLNFDTNQWQDTMDYMMTEIEFNNGVSYDTYSGTMFEFHTNGTLKVYETKPESVGDFNSYGFYVDNSGVVYTMTSDGWGTVLVNSKGKVIKDFKDDDNISITEVSYIDDGKWLIKIKNDEGAIYYTIVDHTAKFLFEPVKTDASYVLHENGSAFIGIDGSQPNYGKKIIIDSNGKVLFESKHDGSHIYLKNGIIRETNSTDWQDDEFDEYTRLNTAD